MAEENVVEQKSKGWKASGEPFLTDAVNKTVERFKEYASPYPSHTKEATIAVKKEKILEILSFLKTEESLKFDYLSDLTAVHYPENEFPIVVVYHLYSTERKDSLRVKVELKEGESIESAVSIWPAANWMEREAYDLLGVKFDSHPNLKRILLPDEWEGHPLRKEYPLGGAQEKEIRANKYGKPFLLPDDLEEARKIIEEGKNAE
ncbi:MAG: NADH-quinone oxidoreductase subunit C [Acidobacteria bacterium]|nr:NADH-quinone oxidoreductase subunit C [Acidobacteriota bacterium]